MTWRNGILVRAVWDPDRQEWWVTHDQLQEDGTARLVERGFCPSLHVISEWLQAVDGKPLEETSVALILR